MAEENIIPFQPRAKTAPLFQVLPQPQSAKCLHTSTRLDHKGRELYCAICGAVIDPYDYLLGIVESAGSFSAWIEELKTQQRLEAKRLDKLKAQARRAQAEKAALERELAALQSQLRLDFGGPEEAIAACRRILGNE